MQRYEMICVGAGPAGLAAAVEAAKNGVQVIVYDENELPGGQLFKQIHKFFGSKEHRAMERGFNIGNSFLDEAKEFGVEVSLNSVVLGIYENGGLNVMIGDRIEQVKAQKSVIATGASENMIPFPGWTLPGVIGAGAAQTMANIHGIRPGNDILMVGSGNVGVIVSYQMMQAGSRVAAVIDAAPEIGGYAVHAAKIARVGVPFMMSHTIKEAHGKDRVEGATVIEVDESWQPIAGTEKKLDVDTICIAVGLNPMTQLVRMAGCKTAFVPAMGGRIPVHDENQETSIKGIYVAGDVSGIEEASTAIIEGRIAGLAIAHSLGYLDEPSFLEQRQQQYHSMRGLRSGSHGEARGKAKEYLNAVMKGSLNAL
jgi:thioredoxin reductase